MICPALNEELLSESPAENAYGSLALADADRAPVASSARADLITTVRSRMKKGYYNSPDVIDELSDSFARVFNEKS